MKIFTDASLDNGALGASCVFVSDDDRFIGSFGSFFSADSSNFGELYALYTALHYATKVADEKELKEIHIFSDSESILRRIKSYVSCLSKTQGTLSHKDKKFLKRLENNLSPVQKKVLSEILNLFEENKEINFKLTRVQGHQKPKNNLRTEDDFNCYWNDCADRFAAKVREFGQAQFGNEDQKDISVRKEVFMYEEISAGTFNRELIEGKGNGISRFLNANEKYSIKNVGNRGGSYKNVTITVTTDMEEDEPQKEKPKENRIVRVAHKARRKPNGNVGRGPYV